MKSNSMTQLLIDDIDAEGLFDYAIQNGILAYYDTVCINARFHVLNDIPFCYFGYSSESRVKLTLTNKTRTAVFEPLCLSVEEGFSDDDKAVYDLLLIYINSSFSLSHDGTTMVGPHLYERWWNNEIIVSMLLDYDSFYITYSSALSLFVRSAFDPYYIVRRNGDRRAGNTVLSELSSFKYYDRVNKRSVSRLIDSNLVFTTDPKYWEDRESLLKGNMSEVMIYTEESRLYMRMFKNRYEYVYGSDALWCKDVTDGYIVMLDKRIKIPAISNLFVNIKSQICKLRPDVKE